MNNKGRQRKTLDVILEEKGIDKLDDRKIRIVKIGFACGSYEDQNSSV